MEGPHTSPTIPSLAMLAIQEEGSNNLEPKITIISPVMSARDFTGASPIEHSFSTVEIVFKTPLKLEESRSTGPLSKLLQQSRYYFLLCRSLFHQKLHVKVTKIYFSFTNYLF